MKNTYIITKYDLFIILPYAFFNSKGIVVANRTKRKRKIMYFLFLLRRYLCKHYKRPMKKMFTPIEHVGGAES